ncbi:hypothetical protein D3C87_1530020 [compost metagenome]
MRAHIVQGMPSFEGVQAFRSIEDTNARIWRRLGIAAARVLLQAVLRLLRETGAEQQLRPSMQRSEFRLSAQHHYLPCCASSELPSNPTSGPEQ